jgi:NAD(P)-dependent dehydrogenase (short-subunit alcohol dehydrogenase family)
MENKKAYIITGPTSGIGYETALELAEHGTVVLVGRNLKKLEQVEETIKENGQNAVSVVCDISDIISVRNAAQKIIDFDLPIAGLLNNAGIMQMKTPTKSAQGWDMSFATNHLGAFALTETLLPYLPNSTNVVFLASAVEDPERKPAKLTGMRGGRYISAEASARGEWGEGGSKIAGADAYATSKQCIMAACMAFARETPRLHFNMVEPGITPGTGLARDTSPIIGYIFGLAMKFVPPFSEYCSTPKKAAKIITNILTDSSGKTGLYYDEKGRPMQCSEQLKDTKFQDRVVRETRALLAKVK